MGLKFQSGRRLALLSAALVAGCAGLAVDEPGRALRGDIAVERLALLPEALIESSGLARVEGRLWTINDSGDGAFIYQLTEKGEAVAKRLQLRDAVNIDWEALAFDGEALYVADCGNNSGDRARLDLYRIAVGDLALPDGSTVAARRIRFGYGDRPEAAAASEHNHDCEAIAAVGDEIWLFSKNRGDGHSRLYRLDRFSPEQRPLPVASYPVDGLITGADYDPVGERLALLGYSRERLPGHSFLWLLPLRDGLPDWSQAQRYRLETYAQWEAISWDGAARLLLTAERSPLGDATLGEIRLDDSGVPLPARGAAADDLW